MTYTNTSEEHASDGILTEQVSHCTTISQPSQTTTHLITNDS